MNPELIAALIRAMTMRSQYEADADRRLGPQGPRSRGPQSFPPGMVDPRTARQGVTKRDLDYYRNYAPDLPMPSQKGSKPSDQERRFEERVARDEELGEMDMNEMARRHGKAPTGQFWTEQNRGRGGDAYYQQLIEDLAAEDLLRPQLPSDLHSSGSGKSPGSEWMGDADAAGQLPFLNPKRMEQWQEDDSGMIWVPGRGWCTPQEVEEMEEDEPETS